MSLLDSSPDADIVVINHAGLDRYLTLADWDDCIQRFHHDRHGITEAVITRATSHGQNPYEWLTDGLKDPGVVFDLACGSAPARAQLGPNGIGLDANPSELLAAHLDTTGRAIRADLTSLPLDTESCDTIVCSMALMLVEPLHAALQQMQRVLKPDGIIRILLPATGPLTPPGPTPLRPTCRQLAHHHAVPTHTPAPRPRAPTSRRRASYRR